MVLGVRFAIALAVALVALVVESAPCHAFCRTTTSKAPPGWDPSVSGCWTEGVPLAWSVKRVPYAVASTASNQVSLADATRVADLAFSAWNEVYCGGRPAGIQAYDDGPIAVPSGLEGNGLNAWVACPEISQCNPAAHDVIVFDDGGWPYNDPANTLALTTVTYGVDDGRIAQAFTEINSAGQKLTTAEPPPAGGGVYDLQAILTHEAGHFLGLAHATDTNSIMYAYYQPGAIELTADDMYGLCTVYQHSSSSPSSKGGGGCTSGGAEPVPLTVAVGASFAALGMILRRRRRAPRRTRGPGVTS
jgi:hypothetical protein